MRSDSFSLQIRGNRMKMKWLVIIRDLTLKQ